MGVVLTAAVSSEMAQKRSSTNGAAEGSRSGLLVAQQILSDKLGHDNEVRLNEHSSLLIS